MNRAKVIFAIGFAVCALASAILQSPAVGGLTIAFGIGFAGLSAQDAWKKLNG